MDHSPIYTDFMQYGEVLVTGGTGFLGAHVCRALVGAGHLPRLLAREGSEGKIPAAIRHACRVTLGDITDRDSVENAAQGTSAIVHLAGILREDRERGETFDRVHVRGTRNVVRAAKLWGIERIVHVGVFGARPGDPSPFFDSKGRGEEIVRNSGLRWTILRPTAIFGEGDGFTSRIAERLRGVPLFPVPGPGGARMQPVFAGDVARAAAAALSRPDLEGSALDVGGPEVLTLDELIDTVAASLRRRARKVHVPLPLLRALAGRFAGSGRFPLPPAAIEILARNLVCDAAPFEKALGRRLLSLDAYLAGAARAVPAALPAAEIPVVPRPSGDTGNVPAPGEEAPPYRKSA